MRPVHSTLEQKRVSGGSAACRRSVTRRPASSLRVMTPEYGRLTQPERAVAEPSVGVSDRRNLEARLNPQANRGTRADGAVTAGCSQPGSGTAAAHQINERVKIVRCAGSRFAGSPVSELRSTIDDIAESIPHSARIDNPSPRGEWAAGMSRAVRCWGQRHGRRFPWRSTHGSFELAVAEVLLQKTRAEAIVPVWSEVLRQWPSPDRLMTAEAAEIRKSVDHLGLGSQRTHRLRQMASALAYDRRPVAGLGPYGNAILEISEGRSPGEPPVDGNIARIVTRWAGLSFDRGEPRKKGEVRAIVGELLACTRRDDAVGTVYALVDLGATVCKPRSPRCSICPLRESCRWAVSASRIAAASAAASGGGTASET